MLPDGELPVPLEPNGGVGGGGFSPASLEFRILLDSARYSDPDPCYTIERIAVDLASGEKGVPIKVPGGDPPVVIQAGGLDGACESD